MIGLGMEGQKLKMTLQIKGLVPADWLNVAFEMIKGFKQRKRVKRTLFNYYYNGIFSLFVKKYCECV